MTLSTMLSKGYFKAISLILVFGLLCPQAVWADVIADEIREGGISAPLVSINENDDTTQRMNEAVEEVEPIAEQPPQPETKPLTKKEEILAKIFGKLQERWAKRIEKAENREAKEAQEIPGQDVSNQRIVYNIGRRVERIIEKVMEGPVGKIIKEIQAKRQEIISRKELAHKVKVLVTHLKELALRSEVIYNRVRHIERLTTGYGEVHTIDETDDVTSIDEIEEVNIPTPEEIKQAIEALEDIKAEVASIKDELANLIVLDDDGNPVEIPATVVTEIKKALEMAEKLQLKIDGYIAELKKALEADPILGEIQRVNAYLGELKLEVHEILAQVREEGRLNPEAIEEAIDKLHTVSLKAEDVVAALKGILESHPNLEEPVEATIRRAVELQEAVADYIQELTRMLLEARILLLKELYAKLYQLVEETKANLKEVRLAYQAKKEALVEEIQDAVTSEERLAIINELKLLGEERDKIMADIVASYEQKKNELLAAIARVVGDREELKLFAELLQGVWQAASYALASFSNDSDDEQFETDFGIAFWGGLVSLYTVFIEAAGSAGPSLSSALLPLEVAGALIALNHRDDIIRGLQGVIGAIRDATSRVVSAGAEIGAAAVQAITEVAQGTIDAIGGIIGGLGGLIGAIVGEEREDPEPSPSPSPSPAASPSDEDEGEDENEDDEEGDEEGEEEEIPPQPAPSPSPSPSASPEA